MSTTAPPTDDLGVPVALPGRVERIVSLVPNLPDLVLADEEENRERDVEALRALEPEVLLLPDEPHAFAAAEVAEMERAGLRALLVDGMDLWLWGPRSVRRCARGARRRQ